MPTISETKENVRTQVAELIAGNKIKNHAELSRILGFSKAAVSEMLNLNSKKRVSENFLMKFEKKFLIPQESMDIMEQIKEILAVQKVLVDTCAQLLSQSSGKAYAVAVAELKQAIKLNT